MTTLPCFALYSVRRMITEINNETFEICVNECIKVRLASISVIMILIKQKIEPNKLFLEVSLEILGHR